MRVEETNGIRVLHLPEDGATISSPDDAADLVGDAWAHQAGLVAVPVGRLDPKFFRLKSGIAGEITQKLVNYRLRLAVVGDIAEHAAKSAALRDFIWESNRGEQIWFVESEAALSERLSSRSAR